MTPQQIRHFFVLDDPTIAYPERITHAKVVGADEYVHLGCIASVSIRDLEDYFVAQYAPPRARTCAECDGTIEKRHRLSWDAEIAMKRRYDKAAAR